MKNTGKMKLCKYCQTEIPKKTKVCPNCRKKQGGKMKWIVIGVIVFFWLIGAVFGGSNNDESKKNDNSVSETNIEFSNGNKEEKLKENENNEIKEVEKENEEEFTYKDMTVKYLKHEVTVDDIGQTVLVIYYDFTNNSGENKTFDFVFEDNCFQNGVEVERSFWHANDESHNSGKEIKSGVTITVASSFVLGENREAVELEITPWIGSKVLFEKTLELK